MAEEYPSNSNRAKNDKPAAPEKKVEAVVSGGAKTRKKSEAKKLADTFISEDAGNVKNYILVDVLIPAIKKAVCDIVTNGIEMILYGETGRAKGSTVNYSKISTRRYDRSGERRDYTASARRGFNYDEVIVPSRGEAQKILDCMDEVIAQYRFVSIFDLYELAGLDAPYTYDKYGWSDISTARVLSVREGYLIKLPRPVPVD